MKKINMLREGAAHWLGRSLKVALVAALVPLLSGCYLNKLVHDIQRTGSYTVPWWCQGAGGTTDLTETQCRIFSLDTDIALNMAYRKYPTVADLPVTAGTANLAPQTAGQAYVLDPILPTTFNSRSPNMFMYDGNSPDSKLVGYGWMLNSASAPAGFDGDRDVWATDGIAEHWLTVWITRGYENHPNVFADSHPCLTATGAIAHDAGELGANCYTASHTEALEILVTNDDGAGSPGIDAMVEALKLEPNVTVTVVAPAGGQSGSGNQVSPVSELFVSTDVTQTASGHPATAIASTDLSPPRNGSGSPADSVLWAIKQMKLTPDVIVSGTNKGQNVGTLSDLSGTVGAARTARNSGVPAIATSTGGDKLIAGPHDFAAGAAETIKLFKQWRLGQTEHRDTWDTVLSINIPSCVLQDSVPIRGTLQTVLTVGGCIPSNPDATSMDCLTPGQGGTSVDQVDGTTDVEAWHNGYVSISNVGASYPAICP